ncbi:MAG: hypothetical protein J6Q65_05510, partial [Lentisphaeria bacterium]|nr:hypothetical protein [Lentisphaeria bacterium]
MKLADLLKPLGQVVAKTVCDPETEVTAIVNNTQKIVPGSLFCAIRGAKFDGHDYLETAAQNGAKVLVIADDWRGIVPDGTDVIRVTDPYLAWGILCAAENGMPAEHFDLLGVTRTNGKTSTAILMHYFLTACGKKCGLLTTVFNDVCDGIRTPAVNTMPDAAALQKLFAAMHAHQADFVSMECSSHGLAQSRSGNAVYRCAVFTNLTGDHLDYHGTMEAYYQAKKKLFTGFAAPDQVAVINVDDAYGRRLYRELEGRIGKRISFSFHDPNADCRISDPEMTASGSAFTMKLEGQTIRLKIRLTGLHNISNLVGAMLAARGMGMPLDLLIRAAETAPAAPGRLESFELENG